MSLHRVILVFQRQDVDTVAWTARIRRATKKQESTDKVVGVYHALLEESPDLDPVEDHIRATHGSTATIAAAYLIVPGGKLPRLSSLTSIEQQLYKRDVLFALDAADESLVDAKLRARIDFDASGGGARNLSACDRLEADLRETPLADRTPEEITRRMQEYVNEALLENVHKRTGKMRRFVAVMSNNPFKLHEYRLFFDQYGIEVLRFPKCKNDDDDGAAAAILLRVLLQHCRTPLVVPLCVFREKGHIFRPGSEGLVLSSMRQGVQAENVSQITWWHWDKVQGEQILSHSETHRTLGYIDLERRGGGGGGDAKIAVAPSFGWDDIFILNKVGLSFDQLVRRGLKVSSRDMVLSRLVHHLVHYAQPRDLRHQPQHPTRPIDFRLTVASFVQNHPLLHLPAVQACGGMGNLVQRVLAQGVFFRGADNRRQGVYWLPSLNSGLPLVPKKDQIHELTYMIHDMGHARMPDLVPTHDPTSIPAIEAKELERIYIIYRMMSEAVTLVLADYVFVDALVRDRVNLPAEFRDYDFGARRIWPLFDALKRPVHEASGWSLNERVLNLRALLYANVRFVLCGDGVPFQKLIDEATKGNSEQKASAEAHLEAYRIKYVPFFSEDYRWTIRNYSHMMTHGSGLSSWWSSINEVRDVLAHETDSLPIESVSGYRDELRAFEHAAGEHSGRSMGDQVDRVFDFVFERDIAPCLFSRKQACVTSDIAAAANADSLGPLKRAFARYLAGQMVLFTRYNVPTLKGPLKVFETRLFEQFRVVQASSEQNQMFVAIDACRSTYEEALAFLLSCNVVSLDDVATFKEVLPLFPAFFVSYDCVESCDIACLSAYWREHIAC